MPSGLGGSNPSSPTYKTYKYEKEIISNIYNSFYNSCINFKFLYSKRKLFSMREYLTQRFLRNNHNKYHKYLKEWIQNITPDQMKYFREEKRRLGL